MLLLSGHVSSLIHLSLLFSVSLAQEADLNYMAITGWYDGCNSTSSPDDRCAGQPYTPLADPIYLELDTCYVNPASPSSVTYYKQRLPSGSIVEFNVIFTNSVFMRMPTICSEDGVCICGDDFGVIQQEVGDTSCNDLFSFSYQCKSQIVSEVLEPTSCYVPYFLAATGDPPPQDEDGSTMLECSMMAAIESFPPHIFQPATTPVAAVTEPHVVPTTAPSVASAIKDPSTAETLAPTVSPSIMLKQPTTPTNSPVNLRTPFPTTQSYQVAPSEENSNTADNSIDDDSINDSDDYNILEVKPGLLAAVLLVGVAFCGLVAWASYPEEGYSSCQNFLVKNCSCHACCLSGSDSRLSSRCRILSACWHRDPVDRDGVGSSTTAGTGSYHKTPDDTKDDDQMWGKDAAMDRHNDAVSLASVSRASQTQTTNGMSNQSSGNTTSTSQKRYLMMVSKMKLDNVLAPAEIG